MGDEYLVWHSFVHLLLEGFHTLHVVLGVQCRFSLDCVGSECLLFCHLGHYVFKKH